MELTPFRIIGGTIQDGVTAATGGGMRGAMTLNQVLTLITNTLMVVIGALAVFFIIFGGVKYLTSGGDKDKVTSAKNTILYAVIGLVIALLARVIVQLVLNAMAGGTF